MRIITFLALLLAPVGCYAFHFSNSIKLSTKSFVSQNTNRIISRKSSNNPLKMNFFSDAARFFTNLNKEASAKHILIKGANADSKLLKIKEELEAADDVSAAFSEIAAKVGYF
jgi:hypothetical protein